ncbi:MAG: phosphatidylglycerophosphatase A [Candidatus Omnitrophica bacterium CG12_big_fil_rev_8_21_14_0_65_42_8]|nr:MAG: phosphatidylglycerophosphatase A [Candidatus Omnitrophica bacterium CG12_big_fil_rev_8_21_14_0_65_42_8]
MKGRLYKMIASVFYIGYLPVAPGTLGSLSALILYYFLWHNAMIMAIVTIVVILLGFMASGRVEKMFGEKDPREIVIDEFSGMLVSLYRIPPAMGYVVTGFLLFRFFDIVKPGPINKLEKLKGSMGIMSDDLIAGVYTNMILQVIYIINLLFR